MFVAERSRWTYDTSGSVGAGYGIYAGEIGELVLKDPQGHEVDLKYGGGGVGPGIGVKLPKVAKRFVQRFMDDFVGHEMSGGVGPFSFTSSGTVYRTRWCQHDELTREDLQGGCMFGEVNIGLLKSRTATIFLLGMNLAALMRLVQASLPPIDDITHIPPRAIILAKGTGLGVGIGADIYAGAAT